MYIISLVLALFSGLLISTQGTLNSIVSKGIGTPAMIAWLSLVQAIPALIYILIKQPSIGLGQSIVQGFKWYAAAGIIGIVILSFLTYSISNIGALSAFVIVILGQIIGAAIIDQFGLFGAQIKPMNTLRLISIGIIILGVGLLVKSEPQKQSVESNSPQQVISENKSAS